MIEERAKQPSLRRIVWESEKWEKNEIMKNKCLARSTESLQNYKTALYAKMSRFGYSEL